VKNLSVLSDKYLPRANKSLHRNAVSWLVELQRLSASGELGRYAANPC
jgi:hypothetical protein